MRLRQMVLSQLARVLISHMEKGTASKPFIKQNLTNFRVSRKFWKFNAHQFQPNKDVSLRFGKKIVLIQLVKEINSCPKFV